MRETIWKLIRSRVPAGMIFPWWALAVRGLLFPLQFFYWRMNCAQGYQIMTDTWKIGGVTYSASALHQLAQSRGEVYRVTRCGDVVVLERLRDRS